MFQRFFSKLGGISIYVLAFALGGLGTYFWLHTNFFSPLDSAETAERTFEIQKGWNIKKISRELEEQHFVKSWWSVYYLSRFRAQNSTDKSKFKILSGEYGLAPAMSPVNILDKILTGKVIYYEATIPEGTRTTEIPALLAKTGIVSAEEVKTLIEDRELLTSLNIPAPSFEGYLFPETYRFTRSDTALSMVSQLAQEGAKRRTKEMYERAIELGFTFHQVLTLASIIEKETGAAEERALISSVFHNRLKKSMPLQSDPTVIYGIENFDGNLTREHLSAPGPYNTYLNPGLPPTPICNPGAEAILAALYPEDTSYLYFVAKGDGTHVFSETYDEHRENVMQYQKRRAEIEPEKPLTEDEERKRLIQSVIENDTEVRELKEAAE